MLQEFYINHGSVLPYLRMEIINDGRYDFNKFYSAVQDADITFSMESVETGILKVSNQPVHLVQPDELSCEDKYVLQYDWKPRDTRLPGIYKGWFNIDFKGDLKEEGKIFPKGNLIVPIGDELRIYVQ